MTQQHPITPPPEVVQAWSDEALTASGMFEVKMKFATHAARWGSDQELEACCEWLRSKDILEPAIDALRTDRRPSPRPLSLKEQALEALHSASFQPGTDFRQIDPARSATIRRALEQLDD